MQPPNSALVTGPVTAMHLCMARERQQCCYPDPKRLGHHASKALVEEAELTPKPGLVDRRGPGSHHDLSLRLFVVSAHVLRPYFQSMAEEAQRERVQVVLRTTLGAIGRNAESEMLKVTNATNTHRGAIWSLGLLTAAAATQQSPDPAHICRAAGELARLPDSFHCTEESMKLPPWRPHMAFGARTEAIDGFPHVISIGLPTLRRARAMGVPENLARVDALLAIMSTLPDTCILQRGGASALEEVQQEARRIGDLGGTSNAFGSRVFQSLERIMLQRWVSPGGSADLLAATLFLDQLSSVWTSSCD